MAVFPRGIDVKNWVVTLENHYSHSDWGAKKLKSSPVYIYSSWNVKVFIWSTLLQHVSHFASQTYSNVRLIVQNTNGVWVSDWTFWKPRVAWRQRAANQTHTSPPAMGAGTLLCAEVQKTFSREVRKTFLNSVFHRDLVLGGIRCTGRCVGFIKCFSIKQHYYGAFKQISCVCLNTQYELLKARLECEGANYLMKSLCFCIWMRGHFKRGLGCRRNVSSRSSCSPSALSSQAFPSLATVWQASLC